MEGEAGRWREGGGWMEELRERVVDGGRERGVDGGTVGERGGWRDWGGGWRAGLRERGGGREGRGWIEGGGGGGMEGWGGA